MTLSRLVLLALLFAAPGPQAAMAQPACPLEGQKVMLVARLYFGQPGPGGAPIADRRWRAFLTDTLTENFPDGFTVYDAYGQWRDPATGTVARERTKVVELAMQDEEASRERIETVRRAYKDRFGQTSVGAVTGQSCAAF